MRVCYFGTYEQNYPRNKTIIKGLVLNGVKVTEINEPLWEGRVHKINLGLFGKFLLFIRFLLSYFCLFVRGMLVNVDCFIVGYPGHFDVFLAKIISTLKSKPLIFDAFLSLFDSMACDRQIVNKESLIAKFLWKVDKYSCKFAHLVLLDTKEHIDFFCREFSLPSKKFVRIWIGCDDSIFKPSEVKKTDDFTVCFHGKFIPLQGVEYILKAAEILRDEDIHFRIIGEGQTYSQMKTFAKKRNLWNVYFYGMLPMSKIPKLQLESHIGLGIFGDTEKAKRVIPNKIYEIVSLKIPALTGDSAAVRELFTDKKDCMLCEMSNPQAIANAIRMLKKDEILRNRIANGGYEVYLNNCSTEKIGAIVVTAIGKCCSEKSIHQT